MTRLGRIAAAAAVPLLYVATLAILYREVFTTALPGGRRPLGFGWDTIESYWGDLAYFAGRLRVADWPLWDVFEKAGYPDFAVPERGHMYPLHWIFAAAGAALGEVPWWMIQVKALLHHLIAGLLMHAYLRRRELPLAAALVGGLGWMASAPMLIHKASSVLWPIVWVPLAWMAIDRLAERRDLRSAALLGGALGLCGVAGSAPGFFYALLLALPYGALRLVSAVVAAPVGRARLAGQVAGLVALAAALTVSLTLIWVVPLGELTALSQRAERSLDYATSFPLPPVATLVGLAVPPLGVVDAYVGFAGLALALCALAARPRADGGVPVLAIGCAALFLALAFGRGTPLLPFLAEHAPGFDAFRAANRFKLLAAPLLCVAAAHGGAALLAAGPRERVRALAALAGLAILVAVLALTRPAAGAASLGSTLALAGAVVALALVALFTRRAAPLAVLAIAALIALDPQRHVHARSTALEPMPERDPRPWLAGLGDHAVEGQLWDEFVLEQRAGPRLGIRELRGYPAGSSLEYRPYAAYLSALRRAPELLAVLGARHVLWGPHHRLGLSAHILKRPVSESAPAHFERVRDRVHRVRWPAPAVAWYGAVQPVAGGPREVLAAVRATLRTDRPRDTVVIDPDAAAALGGRLAALEPIAPPPAVPGRIVEQRAARVVAEIDAPAAGIAVLAHTMYPGWRVTIDGAPATPLVVDHLLRGVAVDAGRHTIEWQLRPRGHGAFLALWWAAFVAVLCALLPPRPKKLASLAHH